jgi:undecaprenyl diphosphate synthase
MLVYFEPYCMDKTCVSAGFVIILEYSFNEYSIMGVVEMWKFTASKELDSNSDEMVIDTENIPKHIAIIMDGNGRWAKSRKLPRTMGHRAAMEVIKKIVKTASDIGVKYLTLYAFSTENWQRPNDEVNAIMKLLVEYMKKELNSLNKNNVKIRTIGDLSKLPQICIDVLENSKIETKDNSGLVLNLALNYGGRAEILGAFKNIFHDYEKGILSKEDIENLTEKDFENYTYTAGIPDPDIIIRPSGEQRLSNFLLWQCAYSEFWYSDILWPDFTVEHLYKAIFDYQKRDRRFGKVK